MSVVPCAVLVAAVVITGCGSSKKTADSSSSAATSAASSSATTSASTTATTAPASTTGTASTAANALLAKAKAAFIAAPSVRVSGTTYDAGKASRLDLSYSHGGATGSETDGGVTLDFVILGHEVYFKAPDSYWKKELAGKPAALKKVEGKWVKGPDTASGFTDLAEVGDRAKYAGVLFKPTGTFTVAPTKTVGGQACAGLKDQKGTLYVAKSGSRPIEIQENSGPGKAEFSYTNVATPKAPPAADTVSYTELG